MEKATKNYLLGLLAMLLFTYMGCLHDDTFPRLGVLYIDVFTSFTYYIYWVLPYWWFTILIGAIMLGFVFHGIKMVFGKLGW